MSKSIDQMNPLQIIKGIRAKDVAMTDALLKAGIKGTKTRKPVWSVKDVVEIFEAQGIPIDDSTIYRKIK